MQNSRSMILGLALALAIPAAASAQTQERTTSSGDTKNAVCRVTNVNSNEKSFTADCPEGQMTFATTSTTMFSRATTGASGGGATASMSDLKVGDQVRVTFTGQPSGTGAGAGMKMNATKVEIMPTGATQPSSQPMPPGNQQFAVQTTNPQQPASQPPSSTGSQPYGSQQGSKVTGKVVSVDRQNRSLVVETTQGMRETFKLDPSNTAVDFNSIREGEQVEITFTGTGAARTVTNVRMMPESQQKSPSSSQPPSQGGTQSASQSGSQQYGTQPANQRTQPQQGAQGQHNKVTGRVVSVDAQKIVIETPKGRESFTVDPTSTSVNLSNFQQGDQVTVMYAGTGADKKITSIQSAGESRASQRGSASDTQPASQRLPKTASEVPFIGLVGLFMLAAAFGLRYVRRHV
jgi:hypothetical protein